VTVTWSFATETIWRSDQFHAYVALGTEMAVFDLIDPRNPVPGTNRFLGDCHWPPTLAESELAQASDSHLGGVIYSLERPKNDHWWRRPV